MIPTPNDLLAQFERMNPQAVSNPMYQNLKQMVRDNDRDGIHRLAVNLCNSMGLTPEQVYEQAKDRLPNI